MKKPQNGSQSTKARPTTSVPPCANRSSTGTQRSTLNPHRSLAGRLPSWRRLHTIGATWQRIWSSLTFTTSVLALIGFVNVGTIEQLFLLAIVYGYLVYSGMAATAALVSYFTPTGRRGLGYALFFLPSYLVGAVAPVIATSVAESYGMLSSFTLSVMLLFGGIVLLQKVPRTRAAA